MFKNAIIYRILNLHRLSQPQLENGLQQQLFVSCGSLQESSSGWTPPRGEENGPLVESVGGHWILQFKTEVRKVPGAMIKTKAEEASALVEASTGRKPGRKEMRDLKDDARMALLPQAFPRSTLCNVWIDPKTSLLVIDTATSSTADLVITALIKAYDGLQLGRADTQMSPAVGMAQWLQTSEWPNSFVGDSECELRAIDSTKAKVRYNNHTLDIAEVREHINSGKVPTLLGLTYQENVSMVLTDAMVLKKLSFTASDDPATQQKDRFDADVAIATGSLAPAFAALFEALGGLSADTKPDADDGSDSSTQSSSQRAPAMA